MSSARGLRSFQANVTRSTSKSSFAARSTVNFHSKQSCEDKPVRQKKSRKGFRSKSQSSVNRTLLTDMSAGTLLQSLDERVGRSLSPESISRESRETSQESTGSSTTSDKQRGRKKRAATLSPAPVSKGEMPLPEASTQTVNMTPQPASQPRKRGRKKRIFDKNDLQTGTLNPMNTSKLKNIVSLKGITGPSKRGRKRTLSSINVSGQKDNFSLKMDLGNDEELCMDKSNNDELHTSAQPAFYKRLSRSLSPDKKSQSNEPKAVFTDGQGTSLKKDITHFISENQSSKELETKPTKNVFSSLESYMNAESEIVFKSAKTVSDNLITSLKQDSSEFQIKPSKIASESHSQPVKKGKRGPRELSNLSFLNPGKALLSMPSAEDLDLSEGKTLRKHVKSEYGSKVDPDKETKVKSSKQLKTDNDLKPDKRLKSDKKMQDKSGFKVKAKKDIRVKPGKGIPKIFYKKMKLKPGKGTKEREETEMNVNNVPSTSISRMKIWKKEQALLKRKKSGLTLKGGPLKKKRLKLSETDTENLSVLSSRFGNNILSIEGVVENKADQSVLHIPVGDVVKRKPGRPRKHASSEKTNSPPLINVSNQTVTDPQEPQSNYSGDQSAQNQVLQTNKTKRTKRKRRSYKGCLDTTFRIKKCQKKMRLAKASSVDISEDDPLSEKLHDEIVAPSVSEPLSVEVDNNSLRSPAKNSSPSSDNSFQEEHSYAKMSPNESVSESDLPQEPDQLSPFNQSDISVNSAVYTTESSLSKSCVSDNNNCLDSHGALSNLNSANSLAYGVGTEISNAKEDPQDCQLFFKSKTVSNESDHLVLDSELVMKTVQMVQVLGQNQELVQLESEMNQSKNIHTLPSVEIPYNFTLENSDLSIQECSDEIVHTSNRYCDIPVSQDATIASEIGQENSVEVNNKVSSDNSSELSSSENAACKILTTESVEADQSITKQLSDVSENTQTSDISETVLEKTTSVVENPILETQTEEPLLEKSLQKSETSSCSDIANTLANKVGVSLVNEASASDNVISVDTGSNEELLQDGGTRNGTEQKLFHENKGSQTNLMIEESTLTTESMPDSPISEQENSPSSSMQLCATNHIVPLSVLVDNPVNSLDSPPLLTPQESCHSPISLPNSEHSYTVSPQITPPLENYQEPQVLPKVSLEKSNSETPNSYVKPLGTETDSGHKSNGINTVVSDPQSSSFENLSQPNSALNIDPGVQNNGQGTAFKKPRGRPKKIKSGKKPPTKSVTKRVIKKKLLDPKLVQSLGQKPEPRTFALRPQISRSPLENIAMRFGTEKGYLALNKKYKVIFDNSTSPESKHLSVEDLMKQCKPCSVILTDFVKQLNLSAIDTSNEEWTDGSDEEVDQSDNIVNSSFLQTQLITEVDPNAGHHLSPKAKSPQSARKSTLYPSPSKIKSSQYPFPKDPDTLASEILQMFASYKCKYCNFCSESSQLIEQHVNEHQNYFSDFPIGCSLCGRRYANLATFDAHHSRIHPLEPRKYVEFSSMDEKEHYQILLQDGSVIDLKIPNEETKESPVQETDSHLTPTTLDTEILLPPELSLVSSLLSETPTVISDNRTMTSENVIPIQNADAVHSPIVDLLPIQADPLLEKTGNTCVDGSISNAVLGTMTSLLDDIEKLESRSENMDGGKGELTVKENAILNSKDARPETILPSENVVEKCPSGVSMSSNLQESFTVQSSGEETVNDKDESDNLSTSHSSCMDTNSMHVNPIVEKLRKIVKSVPQTITQSNKTGVTTTASIDSTRPVVLQTGQEGAMKSSVITSPSSAPVIISVVVSGNVEVNTHDSGHTQLTSQKPGPNQFVCTFCMHGSSDRSRMVEHVTLMHSDEAQFTCCICDKAFSSNVNTIHQHIKTSHPGQDENKFCKPLPSFYAMDEVVEHDNLRSKASDNIFEMFSTKPQQTPTTSASNEPIRQHFRKARDAMCIREKARRQAEADSTTSLFGEETNTTSSSQPPDSDNQRKDKLDDSIAGTDTTNHSEDLVLNIPDKCTDIVSSSKKTCSTPSTSPALVEDVEDSSMDTTPADTDYSPIGVLEDTSANTSGPNLKIISVVSLSAEANPGLSHGPEAESISLEAAKSAVSALLGKPPTNFQPDTKCEFCEKNFGSVSLLISHLKVIHRRMSYLHCPVCDLDLGQETEVAQQHMEDSHSGENVVLEICVKPDKITEHVEEAKSSTDVSEGIQCQHCSLYEPSAGAMLEHLETIHGESCVLICPYCRKGVSKEEEKVYQHIRDQHKNYDPFVPLLLVTNQPRTNVAKPPQKSLLTISKSRREMFAQKTLSSYVSPNSDKEQAVDNQNEKLSKDISGIPNSPDKIVAETQCKSVETESNSCPQTSVTSSSQYPLAALAASAILSQAAAVDPVSASLDPLESSGSLLSSIFNVQPKSSVNQQTTTSAKPPNTSPISVPCRVSTNPCSGDPQAPVVIEQKPRSIVPRGIKHVKKRPLKDIKPFSHPFNDPVPFNTAGLSPGMNSIAPLKSVTAVATTVTKPLLRIPNVSPMLSKSPASTYGCGVENPTASPPLSLTPGQQSTALPCKETPLDLTVSNRKSVEPICEEDDNPDAFNVFNLAPGTQPLNLSKNPSPHTWGSQHQMTGYQSSPVYSPFPTGQRAYQPRPSVQYQDIPKYPQMPIFRMRNLRHRSPSPTVTKSPAAGSPNIQTQSRFSPQMVRQGWNHTPQNQQQHNFQPKPSSITNQATVMNPYYRTLRCPSCDFTSDKDTTMKAHFTLVHKARYRCPYCPGLVPLTKHDVPVHIRGKHPGLKIMFFNL